MIRSLDSHAARVLLVVSAFSSENRSLNGLTKLAKLDFLLRYPAFLQELNQSRGLETPADVAARDVERRATEAPMIRFKYGPWDTRYYAIIGALVGTGLVMYTSAGDLLSLRTTVRGEAIARTLRTADSWKDVERRVSFLRANYDLTGNRLKELIYETFPDLVSQRYRTTIAASPGGADA